MQPFKHKILICGLLALVGCSQSEVQQGYEQRSKIPGNISAVVANSNEAEEEVDAPHGQSSNVEQAQAEPESGDSPTPSVETIAEENVPEALPPAIVSGAYLSCLRAADDLSVACVLEDSNKRVVTPPANAVLKWTIMAPGGVNEVAVPFKTKIMPDVGPMYYVTTGGASVGELHVNIQAADESYDFRFELAPLYSGGANLYQAVEVDVVPSGFAPGIPLGLLLADAWGDGALADENDSCLSTLSKRNAPYRSITGALEFQGGTVSKMGAYLKDTCGIQGRANAAIVSGNAPTRPMTVMLTPGAKNLQLFSNQTLTNDTLRIQIISGPLPSGGLDDFNAGTIIFTGTRSSTNNTTTNVSVVEKSN